MTDLSPRLLRHWLASLTPHQRKTVAASLNPKQADRLRTIWALWARDDQLPPSGDWAYWVLNGGRGAGKTRTGSETVREWTKRYRYVNLVGPTVATARDIMIEGESGILACCPKDERPEWKPWQSLVEWPNGARSYVLSADDPERLRGRQHEKLWCDEICAWSHSESWDQLKFGLRLGDSPQAIITTTPKPRKFYSDLLKDPATVVSRVSSFANQANLAPQFFKAIVSQYHGTRLERQELYAEVIDDLPGALWRQSEIEAGRLSSGASLPPLRRIVVSVDPAMSSAEHSDETGIVVVAAGVDARGYVLEDCSGVATPREWARRVIDAARRWGADAVVYEVNAGGDLIEHALRAEISGLAAGRPPKMVAVRATKAKVARAEPVALLYEQGRISHVGDYPKLEEQMVNMTVDFDRSRAGYSPDRVDALVWGFSHLWPKMHERPVQPPPPPYSSPFLGEISGRRFI